MSNDTADENRADRDGPAAVAVVLLAAALIVFLISRIV